MTVPITNYLFLFCIILLSSFIHSSAGFGFSVFAMTLLPLLFPLISSAAIVKVALLIITCMMTVSLRKHINLKFIIIPTISSFVGNSIGFYLLMTVNADLLKRVLGCVLILIGIYMYFFSGKLKIKTTLFMGICMGFIAGIMGGLFNLSGVVLVIYYFSALEDKNEYVASLQATFILMALYGIILNITWGNYASPGMLEYVLLTITGVLIGCFAGLKVLKRVNKKIIGRLAYSYMILMGIFMVINIQ